MIRDEEVTGVSPALMAGRCYEWSKTEPGIAVPSLDSLTGSLLREAFSGRQRLFQAVTNAGTVVGQVVARLSAELKCSPETSLGTLGFFASLNYPQLIGEMLSEATRWLENQGATCVVGPMDGDTWHSYRLNNGPFDEVPFLMEPTNPPWYENLWAAAGFTELQKYFSKVVHDVEGACRSTEASLQKARQAGYRFRALDLDRFDEELATIHQISCRSFADNFLYSDISESRFLDLYRPAKVVADPRLILFAEQPDGLPVGFLFNVVDYYHAVKSMRGGQGWLAKLRFLVNRGRASAVNFKSIGVLPDHRRKSLAGALMHLGYKATLETGFQRANLCLIREGNASDRLDGGHGKILRRYTLYQSENSRFEVR